MSGYQKLKGPQELMDKRRSIAHLTSNVRVDQETDVFRDAIRGYGFSAQNGDVTNMANFVKVIQAIRQDGFPMNFKKALSDVLSTYTFNEGMLGLVIGQFKKWGKGGKVSLETELYSHVDRYIKEVQNRNVRGAERSLKIIDALVSAGANPALGVGDTAYDSALRLAASSISSVDLANKLAQSVTPASTRNRDKILTRALEEAALTFMDTGDASVILNLQAQGAQWPADPGFLSRAIGIFDEGERGGKYPKFSDTPIFQILDTQPAPREAARRALNTTDIINHFVEKDDVRTLTKLLEVGEAHQFKGLLKGLDRVIPNSGGCRDAFNTYCTSKLQSCKATILAQDYGMKPGFLGVTWGATEYQGKMLPNDLYKQVVAIDKAIKNKDGAQLEVIYDNADKSSKTKPWFRTRGDVEKRVLENLGQRDEQGLRQLAEAKSQTVQSGFPPEGSSSVQTPLSESKASVGPSRTQHATLTDAVAPSPPSEGPRSDTPNIELK